MNIAQLLPASRIRLGVRAASREQANQRLLALLEADGCLRDRACFERDLMAREAQTSTAVQGGLALPHARSEGVEQPAAALLVLAEPLDCSSMDGVPVDLLLMIASPQDGTVHMQAIAALAMALERDGVRDALRGAKSPEEAAALLAERDAPVPAPACSAQQPRVLVVTACPSGIAHTYMAAQAFREAAQTLGVPVKIETNGSRGVENALTAEDIRCAQAVILAADRQVETGRFEGKRVISVPVAEGIHRPEELLRQALGEPAAQPMQAISAPVRTARRFYKYLMNGVSYMLPFLVAGGVLSALGRLLAGGTVGSFAALAMSVGWAAIALAGPVAAGGIGYAIADRPGLMPGFVGGLLVQAAGGGLVSAMTVGFFAGFAALVLARLTRRMPFAMDSVRTMLLCPVAALLAVGLFVNAFAPMFGGAGQWFVGALAALDGPAAVLLGCVLGAMMNVDFGGPVNKAAYLFGTAALAAGGGRVMAAVMIGGMVPSFATAAATALFPAAFDEQERRHGRTNWLLGASFISEGALPFVPGAPRAVKLACMTGGALAGGLSMLAGCSLPAPCGGLFLFPLGQNVGGGLAALAAGSLLGGVLFGLMRGRKMRLSVSNRYEN